jgi:hypothetical protein
MGGFFGAVVFVLCLAAGLISPAFAADTDAARSPVECYYYFVFPLEASDSWQIFVHRSTPGHSFFVSFPVLAGDFDRYRHAFQAAGCAEHPPLGGI